MKIGHTILLVSAIASGFLLPDLIQSVFKNDQGVDSGSYIDLDNYCIVSTTPCYQNDVSLTLEHDTVKPLIPSKLVVTWNGSSSETLQLSLKGLEMEMGIVKFQLSKQSNGSFSETLFLPVCSQESMTWLGTLSDGKSEIYLVIRMKK